MRRGAFSSGAGWGGRRYIVIFVVYCDVLIDFLWQNSFHFHFSFTTDKKAFLKESVIWHSLEKSQGKTHQNVQSSIRTFTDS